MTTSSIFRDRRKHNVKEEENERRKDKRQVLVQRKGKKKAEQ